MSTSLNVNCGHLKKVQPSQRQNKGTEKTEKTMAREVPLREYNQYQIRKLNSQEVKNVAMPALKYSSITIDKLLLNEFHASLLTGNLYGWFPASAPPLNTWWKEEMNGPRGITFRPDGEDHTALQILNLVLYTGTSWEFR